MANKPDERRKYVRVDVEAKVNFQVGEGKEFSSDKFSGVSKNISAEGVCFDSPTKLDSGTKLKLNITLAPNAKPLHLAGEVKWSEASKVGKSIFTTGVKLFTVDKADEAKFMGYVCEKMTERLSQYLHL